MSAENGEHSFTLFAPTASASLPVIRSVVEEVSKLAGYDDQVRYEIVLAVHEACSNVLDHALRQGQRSETMVLECGLTSDGLEFKLRDKGLPFDFDSIPEFDPTELRRGGRGVFLIRRCMDEVNCSALPDGGNELRMFRRTPEEVLSNE